jgi:hypothetical protein
MSIDLRALFDHLNIEWKDRGPNCSRGRVNINCPFCWDDPSCHCTISEATGRWYCFRDSTHYGDAAHLVTKLLADRDERRPRIAALALLDDYDTATDSIPAPPPERKQTAWERFLPAWQSEAMLDYLWERGFDRPDMVARKFDLRYAKQGEWAQRLLIPLYDSESQQQGWTGRAIRNLELRYRAEPPHLIPSLLAGNLLGESLLVVEGPMDALKWNSAMGSALLQCSAIGLTSLNLTADRLSAIARKPRRAIILCLDADAKTHLKLRLMSELRKRPTYGAVLLINPPDNYNDLGAMPEQAVQDWGGALLHAVQMGRGVRELGESLDMGTTRTDRSILAR